MGARGEAVVVPGARVTREIGRTRSLMPPLRHPEFRLHSDLERGEVVMAGSPNRDIPST